MSLQRRNLRPNELGSVVTGLTTPFGKKLDDFLQTVYISSLDVKMCSFYHSLARALIPKYNDMSENNQRLLVQQLREDISKWFTKVEDDDDAIKRINSLPIVLRYIIKNNALSRDSVFYEDFTSYPIELTVLHHQPFSKHILVNYLLDALEDPQMRHEALNFLEQKCAINLNELEETEDYLLQHITSTRNYGKFEDDELVSITDRSSAIGLLQRSINKKTNQLFTLNEIQQLLRTDPRKDTRTPLGANFYASGRAIVEDLDLQSIVKEVENPHLCNGDNILPFIEDIFNINFIICRLYDDHIYVEEIYSTNNQKPYVVLVKHGNDTNIRFSTIGASANGGLKTLFEPYHPLITSLLLDEDYIQGSRSEENIERFKDYQARSLMGITDFPLL